MILWIGAGLLFIALVLAMSIIGVVNKERRGVARSVAAIQAIGRSTPDMLKTELERPFAERVLRPRPEVMEMLPLLRPLPSRTSKNL